MPWLLRLTRRIFKNIDNDVFSKGIQETLNRVIVKKCNTKLEIDISLKTKNILSNQPVLIVANHPAEADPLVTLAAMPKRKDVSLIINSSFMNFGDYINEHLIPVYIGHHLTGTRNWKFTFFKNAFDIKVYSEDVEHEKNIESIKTASEKINKNEAVVIFPMGGSSDYRWLSGVGYLVKDIKNRNKAYFVKAYIEGTSNKDYLRLIPRIGRFFPSFKITFSEPLLLNNFENENARQIALNMEANYNNWVNTLVKREIKPAWNIFPKVSLKGYLLLRTVFMWFMSK